MEFFNDFLLNSSNDLYRKTPEFGSFSNGKFLFDYSRLDFIDDMIGNVLDFFYNWDNKKAFAFENSLVLKVGVGYFLVG